MKHTLITMLTVTFLLTCFQNAPAESENPFGFETTKHPLDYARCKKREAKNPELHFTYECRNAPRMHPDIEAILLFFVEEVGLCNIEAISFMQGPDALNAVVDTFKDQLARKYGPPTSKTEEKSDNAYQTKYRYNWFPEEGFGGVEDVKLLAVARASQGDYRVRVFFRLVTDEACKKKIEEYRSDAF